MAEKKQSKMTLDKLALAVASGFESIDRRFEGVDQRFESIDRRFESIDRRFESIDQHFIEIKSDIVQIKADARDTDDRVRKIEKSVFSMEGKLEDKIVSSLEFEDLRGRVKYLERRMGIESGAAA